METKRHKLYVSEYSRKEYAKTHCEAQSGPHVSEFLYSGKLVCFHIPPKKVMNLPLPALFKRELLELTQIPAS